MSNDAARRIRLPGFYRLPVDERRERLLPPAADLSRAGPARRWTAAGSTPRPPTTWSRTSSASTRCRSASGSTSASTATTYLVPMAVEEPSVIAAASNAARMVREGGGFIAEADDPIMTAQIELVGVADPEAARRRASRRRADELLALAHATLPRLAERGGGAREHRGARRIRGRRDRAPPRRLPRRDGRQPGQHHRRGAGRPAGASSPAGARACASSPTSPTAAACACRRARPGVGAGDRRRSTAPPCATASSPPRASPRSIPTAPPRTTRAS